MKVYYHNPGEDPQIPVDWIETEAPFPASLQKVLSVILQERGLVLECVGKEAIDEKRGVTRGPYGLSRSPFDVLLSAVYKGMEGDTHILDVEGFQFKFKSAKELLNLLHHALNM